MKKLLIAILATGLIGVSASAMAHPHGQPPGLSKHANHSQHSPLQRKFLQAQHDRRPQHRGNSRHAPPKRHQSSRHHHHHHHHHYHGKSRHAPPRHYHNRYRSSSTVFGYSDGQRGVLIIRR